MTNVHDKNQKHSSYLETAEFLNDIMVRVFNATVTTLRNYLTKKNNTQQNKTHKRQ